MAANPNLASGTARGATRFTQLYVAEQPAVLRFVLRRLPAADVNRAEDITQETFITAWRNLAQLPDRDDEARAWLFSVARHRLLQEHRAIARRGALAVRIADHTESAASSHDDEVAYTQDLAAAWRRLPAADQEVLALTAWDGLTAAQAAKVLGISAGNYRIRLHRARAALRRELESEPARLTFTATEPTPSPVLL